MTIRHRLRAEIAEGLHVEFTAPAIRRGDAVALACEWDPAIPPNITPAMRAKYRQARDRFVRQLAAAAGGTAVVLET